jgi:hypothetical protein
MDDLVKSTVSVDKTFFKKERDQFYGNWLIAFYRELFQNSVDAGSRKIAIELNEVEARGSFGNLPEDTDRVTRIVFADDGKGMTADVIDNVYFKMGKSTKDDPGSGTIGGFGRARIMTCFSQNRYSILTKDRFVMGDGVHFEHGSVGRQLAELEKYADALEASQEPGAVESLRAINADIERLREAWTKRGGYPGCRVEVDLDTSPPESWRAKPGTLENMKEALFAYLSESQLPCEVTINGQTPEAFFAHVDGKLQARKGPVRRVLSVPGPDGDVQFATVHLSDGKKAAMKGKMIVRVSGASMFKKDVGGLESQVIVEIDPVLSREALNSNRDGLKGDYERAVDGLLKDLTINTLTALKDKNMKVFEVEGEKGRIKTTAPKMDDAISERLTSEEIGEIVKTSGKVPRITSFEALGNMALHQDILKRFMEKTYRGSSFLIEYLQLNYGADDELHRQLKSLRDGLYGERRKPEWFFENAGEKAKAWVLAGLANRVERTRAAWKEEQDNRIKGVHDIYISMESTNTKTRAAARRHHPDNWNVETGSGKAMRTLLSVWTAACSVAMETLYAVRPGMQDIQWTTGFVYSLPEETHQGDQYRNVATEAACVRINGHDDDLRMLINPVNDDGTLRFSTSDRKDLRRILALAKHEIAHALESYHNETFANVLTELDAALDPDEAFRRMRAEAAGVTAAYAEGKARVHSLDREPGVRPAERLLALAYGNDRNAAREAMEYAGEGIWNVDADAAYESASAPHDDQETKIQNAPRMVAGR